MRGQHAAILARARLLLRLHHDRAGAVAEQHAGAAIGPVEDAREGLRADHQRALVHAGAQQAVGGGKRVDEAGAHRLQVERRAVLMPSAAWIATAVAGKVLSGVEVPTMIRSIDCASTGVVERRPRGLHAEIGGELAVRRDVALADAGALHDPLVGRIDHPRESALVRMRSGR